MLASMLAVGLAPRARADVPPDETAAAAKPAAGVPGEGDDDGDAPGAPLAPAPNDAESALGNQAARAPVVAPVVGGEHAAADAEIPVVIRFRNDVAGGL